MAQCHLKALKKSSNITSIWPCPWFMISVQSVECFYQLCLTGRSVAESMLSVCDDIMFVNIYCTV